MGNIIFGADTATNPLGLQTGSGAYRPKTLLKHGRDLLFSDENQGGSVLFGYSSVAKGAAPPEQENCTDGGSVTRNMTWTGPNDPQDCSQAVGQVMDPSMEFVYTNCQEGTVLLNGTMISGFVGDLCTDTPTALSMDLVNFSYVDSTLPSDFTATLSTSFRDIQYDQPGYIVGATVLLEGTIEGTINGIPANLSYADWTATMSGVKYDANNIIIEMSLTMDGSLQGSIDGELVDEKFDGLTYWVQETSADGIPGILFTLDGKYDGACTGGWVTFETTDPMFWPNEGDCPTQGLFTISGIGEATVTCYSDGSIIIDVDGEELNYDTCNDLEICV